MEENTQAQHDSAVQAPAQPVRHARFPMFLQMLLGVAGWFLLYLQLDRFARWATYSLLGFKRESHLGGAIEFFIADAPKVLMLLVLITFIVGITRTFLTPERIRAMLVGRNEFVGNVLAAILGVPTPLLFVLRDSALPGVPPIGHSVGCDHVLPDFLPGGE